MKPLVSIIIPVYNRAQVLRDTLDSVLDQEYQNWECIIIDDGSKDGSPELITNYSERDSRFKFYSRPKSKRKGASSCRNYGFQLSKGELIQYLDSDDLMHPRKLRAQVDQYNIQRGLSLFTCSWGGFTSINDLSSRFKYKYHAYQAFKKSICLLNTFGLYNEFFPLHVYLTPRKLIEKAGEWNENLTNNDDAEFFTRVILASENIQFVPEAIVYYRYHSKNNLSEINSDQKLTSLIKSIELIREEILKENKFNSKFYFRRAKFNLYNLLLVNNPRMIVELGEFLMERNGYNTFKYFIIKKLKGFNRKF